MVFEDKLRELADKASATCTTRVSKETRRLAGLVAQVLRETAWSHPSAKTDKALKDAAEDARKYARILDATGYLEEKVFEPATGRIEELRLKADLRAVQDQIRDKFVSKAWPERGFVYVAWCQRPEEFWYVGKARTADRLNLAANGKLARATAHATQLAVLFPSQSREEILAGVEAAVMALVEHHTGRPPRLNERRERIARHQGSQALQQLAMFLESVGVDLRAQRAPAN